MSSESSKVIWQMSLQGRRRSANVLEGQGCLVDKSEGGSCLVDKFLSVPKSFSKCVRGAKVFVKCVRGARSSGRQVRGWKSFGRWVRGMKAFGRRVTGARSFGGRVWGKGSVSWWATNRNVSTIPLKSSGRRVSESSKVLGYQGLCPLWVMYWIYTLWWSIQWCSGSKGWQAIGISHCQHCPFPSWVSWHAWQGPCDSHRQLWHHSELTPQSFIPHPWFLIIVSFGAFFSVELLTNPSGNPSLLSSINLPLLPFLLNSFPIFYPISLTPYHSVFLCFLVCEIVDRSFG